MRRFFLVALAVSAVLRGGVALLEHVRADDGDPTGAVASEPLGPEPIVIVDPLNP